MTSPYRHLDAERARTAVGLVRTGQTISLDMPLDGPPLVDSARGRPALVHRARMHNEVRPRPDGGYVVVNDDVVELALQGSSHWDALAHWGAIEPGDESVFADGADLNETSPEFGAKTLGIGLLGGAVVTRGVLLDLVGQLEPAGATHLADNRVIDRAVIEACLAAQDVALEPGDAVLTHTGFHARVAERGFVPDGADGPVAPGLALDTLDLFADAGTFALISDNPSVEPVPMPTGRFHTVALKHHGIHLGELWKLDELTTACRADGVWEFMLVSAPLAIASAFGSPANAVAIR